MNLGTLDYFLWFAGFGLMIALTCVLYARGLYRVYHYFFAYVLLQLFSNPLMFWLATGQTKQSYTAYFCAYYINISFSGAISIAVFWDILVGALGSSEGLRTFLRTTFLGVLVLVLALAVFINFNTRHVQGPYIGWILSCESALRIAQVALILFFIVIRRYLGIARRNVPYGIALGFGFYAAVNLLVIEGIRHRLPGLVTRHINSAAYLVATVIWLFYAWRGSGKIDGRARRLRFPQGWSTLNLGHPAFEPVGVVASTDTSGGAVAGPARS
jgi:hypothetical protein